MEGPASFGAIPGVVRTRVGYAGGKKPNPTYKSIGDHAECLQVDFDPDVLSYEKLLGFFWNDHDPTRHAWSRQYMSAIYYHDKKQKKVARKSKKEKEKELGKIQTVIEAAGTFTLAEDYHQKYRLQHQNALMEALNFASTQDMTDSTAATKINALVYGHAIPEEDVKALNLSVEVMSALEGMRRY